MSIRREMWIAGRYLKSKRREMFISIIAVISVLGVAVSVGVLDIVLAIMTGFEHELQSKLIDSSAHVIVREYGRELHDWEKVEGVVKEVPGVEAASPYSYNQAMLSYQGVAQGMLVRGLPDDVYARGKLEKILEGGGSLSPLFAQAQIQVTRPDGSPDTVSLPSIVIGRALARRFGIEVGMPITLIAPQFSASPQGLIPRLRRFVVVGIYSSGLVEYESGLAYVSLQAAQQFFGLGEAVTGLEVALKDLQLAPVIADEISERLRTSGRVYDIADWTKQNKPLYDALKLEKRVYFIVLLLLILVASFSIISTLVMIVMEKGREIAVLKSIGATDSTILRIFLLQGILIGGTGTVLGSLFGFAGGLGLKEFGFKLDESVFAMSQVPVMMEWPNFVLVAIAGFLITALAGLYPARRAARLRPADALRFE